MDWKSCCSCIPQRWITVVLCLFVMVNAYAMRTCLSIAITEMVAPLNETKESTEQNSTEKQKELYDWDESTQGMILSSFYWSYMISNFIGGEVARRLGGKYTLIFGIFFSATLTVASPIVITWGDSTALVWLRLVMGVGEGLTYPAISALMANWVPEDERSKAGSIIFSGPAVGNIFGNIVAGLILYYSEWPMVFYFFGAIGCLCVAVNFVFLYSKPTENPFISDEEAKYLKENLKNTQSDLPPTPWGKILCSKPVWALVFAAVGNGCGLLTMLSEMPKYMSSVLKFSVQDNGYLSSLPYLALWLVSNITSVIADSCISSGRISIQKVRKIGTTIASLGPAVFLIAASYAAHDRVLVISCITLGLALMGCATFSIFVNALDLGPNYAGSLMGLVNGVATIPGILSPNIVGYLAPNQTLEEWRLVFWIVSIVFVLANLIFLIWGSGKLQDWNDPDFLNEEKKESQAYGKENIQMSTR